MRLIDADALKEKLASIKLYDGVYCKSITEKDIDNAPTVPIPIDQNVWESGYECGKNERQNGEWYDHIPHKCLKARYGGYVLYEVEYLLKHLAMEIYLLEGAGRTRGEGE